MVTFEKDPPHERPLLVPQWYNHSCQMMQRFTFVYSNHTEQLFFDHYHLVNLVIVISNGPIQTLFLQESKKFESLNWNYIIRLSIENELECRKYEVSVLAKIFKFLSYILIYLVPEVSEMDYEEIPSYSRIELFSEIGGIYRHGNFYGH